MKKRNVNSNNGQMNGGFEEFNSAVQQQPVVTNDGMSYEEFEQLNNEQTSAQVRNDDALFNPEWTQAADRNRNSERRQIERNRQGKRKRKKFTPVGIALNCLIVLLIFVGVYLVVRPIIHQWNRDKGTQALLEEYAKQEQAADPSNAEPISATLWVDPNANPINGEGYDLPPGVSADNLVIEEKKNEEGKVKVDAIGRIFIDSIELNLPIVKGATETPLKYGAGWYDYSSPIGEAGGNAVILAHRMLTYGRMFNRLDEVKSGDIVEINYNNTTYKYKVYDSFSIDPNQQDMYEYFKPLENNRTIITLVTCSKDNGRTRLMVRAELMSE